MRTWIYGAALGGMFGAALGWVPALLAAGFLVAMSNGTVPFWWLFFGLWGTVVLLGTSGAAGIGYACGRLIEDE